MEIADFLKLYGPLAIGWIIAGYLGKFVLDRYDKDIESRVKLAVAADGMTTALNGLTAVIRQKLGDPHA